MRLIAVIALVVCGLDGAARAADTGMAVEEQLTLVRTGLPHDALFDVEIDDGNGLAVGNYGAVLATSDAGVSWQPQEELGESALLALALADESVLVVGQQGAIFRREGDGKFEAVESGTTERLLSVALGDNGLAVATGGFGTLLVSRDGGRSWESAVLDWSALNDEGLEAHLYDVEITPAGEIYVVGEFGLVMRSRDAGGSWEALASGDASLFALHLDESGTGFAVGQNGTVLRSDDAGDSWTKLEVGARANLLDVWSSEQGEVVIVGMRALLRSRDRGANWTAATGRLVERTWFQALAMGVVTHSRDNGAMHEEHVYAVGQTGQIVKINR